MGFSAKQVQALRRSLNSRYVRTREVNGRELSYIEGWYAISEANRIFGFDGWNRETAGLPLRPGAGKPRVISSPSMSPKCALPCTPMERPLCAKVMVLVRAGAPRRARSTTLRLRLPRPMPPNERWRRSVNRSDSSSIEKTKTSPCKGCQRSIR